MQLKDPEEGRAFAEDARKMPEYIKEEYDMDYTVNVSAYSGGRQPEEPGRDFGIHGDSFRDPLELSH